MVTLYNTLTKQKGTFEPIDPPHVRLYHCGPTVYNYAHIGNLRAYVFADVLRRTLEHNGYEITQVINITDVGHLTDDADDGEDKIEEQVAKERCSAQEIAQFYTQAFFQDLANLNVKTDETIFPRATNHIDQQIALIQTLEEKGYTYQTADGVYFDTSRYDEYGKLGQVDPAGAQVGARVAASDEKRNPTDFALWRFRPSDKQRQQEWDSPWGVGYPGWHIECSAMAMEYLGETFDIHTGGIDHIPVHHNNEIAQSECATEKPFARFWLHNEFITIADGKMAKSEGNFITLRTLTDEGVHPLAYKYWLMTAHYRSPTTFSFDVVRGAQEALERVAEHHDGLEGADVEPDESYTKQVADALADDLDTPRAIAVLQELIKDEALERGAKKATIRWISDLLGLNIPALAEEMFTFTVPDKVQQLVTKRETARADKDFETADELREKIRSHGFEARDTDTGTRLRKKL